jgi:hypothetical protein
MSVLSRVRRVGAIVASAAVVATVLAIFWLASSTGLLSGATVLWPAGAFLALFSLTSVCLMLALSADASQRRAAGRAS